MYKQCTQKLQKCTIWKWNDDDNNNGGGGGGDDNDVDDQH